MKKILFIKALLFLTLLPSFLFGQATGKFIANRSGGGTISIDTINAGSLFNLHQTTAGQTITVPSLTIGAKTIDVVNIGSVDVTLSPGGVLSPVPAGNSRAQLRWTGAAWAVTMGSSSTGVDTSAVHKTGDEIIRSGVKTFIVSPSVPTPSTGADATNKSYVDTKLAAKQDTGTALLKDGSVALTGDLTVPNNGKIINSAGNSYLEFGAAGVLAITGTPRLSNLSPNTVPYLNGSNDIVSSSTTPTELGYVHGVTSDIQTQLDSISASADSTLTLKKDNNLSDLADKTTAINNLGALDSSLTNGDLLRGDVNGKASGITPSGSITKNSAGKLAFNEYGEIFNDNFKRASVGFGSRYTQIGSTATWTINSNRLRVSNGAGAYTDYINCDSLLNGSSFSALEDYEVGSIVTNISNGDGIAIGFSTVSSASLSAYESTVCRIDMNASGNRGKLYVSTVDAVSHTNTARVNSDSALVFTNSTDSILLRMVRTKNTVVFYATNLTTNLTIRTPAVTITRGSGYSFHKIGKPSIYAIGGTQDVSQFYFFTPNKLNAKLIFTGDSETMGKGSSSLLNRYTSIITNDIKEYSFTVAVGSDQSSHLLSRIKEIIGLKPKYVSIMIGTNDGVKSITLASYTANMTSILSQLTTAGIIPIVITPPYTTNGTTNGFIAQYVGYIQGLAQKYIVVDLTTTALNNAGTLATAYSYDGIHLNDSGYAVLASKFKAVTSGLFTYSGRLAVSGTDQVFIGGASCPNLGTSLVNIIRNSVSTTNTYDRPNLLLRNLSTTHGDGVTTNNNSVINLGANNGSVNIKIEGRYDTDAIGDGGVVGTTTAHDLVLVTGNTEAARFKSGGGITFPATNTAAGTTGNRTINKISGTVNIAAGGTSVTVTNSLVTTSSIIEIGLRTNDSTAWIKNYVPASGSFTINLGAAATAEVSIGFEVKN